MAIRDAKGNLHSEINGRFIEKQEEARRIYDSVAIDRDARRLWASEKSASELRAALIIFADALPDAIPLPDELLPRSVGAKWSNYDIVIGGEVYHIQEGSYIRNKCVFAGKGTRYPIYDAAYLCRDYPEEHARPGDWKKCKGIATLVDKNGKTMEAEIHWYEAISSEKYDVKYKHK